MNKLTGRLLMATAVGHVLVGLVLFREPIAAILNDGFVNAIQPPLYAAEPRFDRIAAFWFLLFSPVLFLLGQITNWAVERRDAHSLKLIGWNLMGIGVFGSVGVKRMTIWRQLRKLGYTHKKRPFAMPSAMRS